MKNIFRILTINPGSTSTKIGVFDNEELVAAIKYAHLYGVRVYVTVNTLIYDNEIDGVMEYLEFLYVNGVDAVIMQDMGLIKLTREVFLSWRFMHQHSVIIIMKKLLSYGKV